MSGNRFGGIGDRLLERVSGGDAAGQVGKAHAVARAFVLVYQCDVACHRPTAFAAIYNARHLPHLLRCHAYGGGVRRYHQPAAPISLFAIAVTMPSSLAALTGRARKRRSKCRREWG